MTGVAPRAIDARTLKKRLHDGAEIALLDVREHGQYGESHLFFAVPLAYSRFELDLPRLAPRAGVPLVLYDSGTEGVAARAAARAVAMGYTDVQVLAGGTAAWQAAGFELFAGVNVPSKAFGELIEHAHRTPRVTPTELAAMRASGENLVIVDGRPLAEYRKMNIPGSVCCPNGELALRIAAIAPDPATTVVVNCAGRTRSIIGAETLRAFGIGNRVLALENGTQGWFLAGLALEHGADRRYPAKPSGGDAARLRERGRTILAEHAIPSIDAATLRAMLDDPARTTYLFDVRTAEEHAGGAPAAAVHAPGGQLVQATDQWVAVRNARIVLVDDDGLRAPLAAMWLRRMGHDAYVLADGAAADVAAPGLPATALPALDRVAAGRLGERRVLDLRASASYRRGHHPGARWSIRPNVVRDAAGAARVALVADDEWLARLAAVDLLEAGIGEIVVLDDPAASESSPGSPPDAERIDYLFFTHDRHDGNRAAAEQYLAWEVNLLAQIDQAERASFRLGR